MLVSCRLRAPGHRAMELTRRPSSAHQSSLAMPTGGRSTDRDALHRDRPPRVPAIRWNGKLYLDAKRVASVLESGEERFGAARVIRAPEPDLLAPGCYRARQRAFGRRAAGCQPHADH